MNAALAYLLWRRRVNGVMQFLRGLGQPKRLIGTLFWFGMIGLMIWAQVRATTHGGPAAADQSAQLLKLLVAMTLIMSVFSGLVQRGLAFQPADIDFLFPGPFSRRALVLYRLCSIYPLALVSSLIFAVVFGSRVPNFWLAFLGLLLAQTVAVHLQAIAALLATMISERVFARMRRGIQLAATVVAGLGIIAVMTSMFESGTFSDHVRRWLSSPTMGVLLYPAVAVEQLATAREMLPALRAALQLAALSAGMLLVALALQVRFFEASIETSRRVSRVIALAGRGIPATTGRDGEQFKELKLPALPVFLGAGAILWKNVIVLTRSLRVLLFALFVAGMIGTSIALVVKQSIDRGEPRDAIPMLLVMCGLLPFLLQSHLAFDFRRDLDAFERLKQLPAHPTRLALAEVALPTLLALAFQLALLVPATLFLRESLDPIWIGLLVYPLTTLGVCTINNLGFLLFPIRTVTAAGRPNPGSTSLMVVFNMFVLALAIVPAAIVVGIVHEATESSTLAVVAGLPVQALVDFALLTLLGWCFRRFDLTKE